MTEDTEEYSGMGEFPDIDIDPKSGNEYPWIVCPECKNENVVIKRNIGDRGGTESFDLFCDDCHSFSKVVP